jgi:transposase-like protein
MMSSKEAQMPNRKPAYPSEFKVETVRLAKRGDRSVRQTAADLGVSYETLRTWIK